MKSREWYYRYPGSFYANGPIRFALPVKESDVRKEVREQNSVTSLPRGMEFWPKGNSVLWPKSEVVPAWCD
jgi:hypothetical protein